MCVFVYCASLQALGPYSVSKTALLGLTRALAPELAHSNIRVNCVAPGVIKTRFSNAVRRKKNTLKSCVYNVGGFVFIYFAAFHENHVVSVNLLSYGKMKTSWTSSKSSSALKGTAHT